MEYIKEIMRELRELDEEADKHFLCRLYIMLRYHKERNCR